MFVLTNGILINGTEREPVKKATIKIEGNRITSVGLQRSFPEKATVIDLKGLVVMPGLIDCHVHLGGTVRPKPGRPPHRDMAGSRSFAGPRKSCIRSGVTSIRSGGDFVPDIFIIRDKIASGQLYGPRVFTAGPLFTAPGGHPAATVYGGDPYVQEHVTRQVADANIARAEVKKLVAMGVDFIKAILHSAPFDHPGVIPKLSLKVLEALTDEAHKHNRRIMVHAESADDAMDAVRIGADEIEHIWRLGAHSNESLDGLIKMMLDKGTHYVPTLAVTWIHEKFLGPQRFPTRKNVKNVVKRLYDAGVHIAAGTDAGAPNINKGSALHKEIELMVEIGMSPMAAIMAATKKAAETLGRGNELGTIEEDKLADIIVVSGNPLNRITDTKNIELVIKDGKILVDKLGLPKIQ